MDMRRSLVAAVVGMVVVYAVGWVLFDKLLMAFYMANAGSATGVWRDTPILWASLVGCLAYAVLIIYTMGRGGEAASAGSGAKVGATVGFLLWATVDFVFYGGTNINSLTTAVVDPLAELVRGGIAGAVIGWVVSKTPASGTGAA